MPGPSESEESGKLKAPDSASEELPGEQKQSSGWEDQIEFHSVSFHQNEYTTEPGFFRISLQRRAVGRLLREG